MIKENQQLLNRLHVLSDGVVVYLSLPAASGSGSMCCGAVR